MDIKAYLDKIGLQHLKSILSEKLAYTETVLYENAEGTRADITLTDDSTNYKYIDVFFKNGDDFNNFVRLTNLSTAQNFCLSTPFINENTLRLNFASSIKKIQNNTITNAYFGEAIISSSVSEVYAENNIYITKVVGYKK